MPKGKTVVLGLVELEAAALGGRRRAGPAHRRSGAKIVPLENLALSPQCGFASVMEGNKMTEEQQWAKLRLVADVARKVWGTSA